MLGTAADRAQAAATFQFRIVDAAGVGFNDPTPFTPEGGNNATTLGAARLNVLEEAGRVWGSLLTSNVTIVVDARVDAALNCTASTATLATAGPLNAFRNPGGPQPDVYFPAALADALAGFNVGGGSTADIRVNVNPAVNNNVSCLNGTRFYYGFDHAGALNQPDLLQVLLHEIGHGLGFLSFVSLTTGEGFIENGVERLGSYDQYIFDESLGLSWVSLTAPQRLQAATRSGFLAWTGTNANRWRTRFSAGSTVNGRLLLYAPATIATGSSVSHWDVSLTPNALMEPFRTPTTTSFTDITSCALKDIGWTVTRCIDAANATPVAQPQTVSVLEDTPTTIVLAGTDADGDPITFALAGTPLKGTLGALATVPQPSTLYSPNLNATGADSFTFIATDENATSPAGTITINITPVNDTPAATPLSVAAQSGQNVGVTLTGTDIDGDALTFTVVAGPSSGTLSGTSPNLTYRSNNGFTGADSFTYRANDAALQSPTVTVSITVSAAPSTGGGGGGGGGGGATGLPLLALLAGLLALSKLRTGRLRA